MTTFNAPAGTVNVFVDEDMDHFVRSGKCSSVHEVSLAELMDMIRLTGDLPTRRALIGIQPEKVDWDEQVTPTVAASMNQVCQQANALLSRWH